MRLNGEMSILFCIVGVPIYVPASNVPEYSLLCILFNTFYFCLFDNSHSDGCEEGIAYCGFDMHFPDD